MASEPLLLAIDAGTGSCRAVLFDAAGRQRAVEQREWSHRPAPGVPGSFSFDTQANWPLIVACVRGALAGADVGGDAVAAVSATSMREGMVLFDAAGRELWACPNVDGRGGAEAAELVASGAAAEIYLRGGDWVAITAPPRLLWLQRHEPELFARVRGLGMFSDWIVHRLCGRHVTEPSAGSSTALFDLETRTWSPASLELCGLSPDVVPEVVESGTVVGAVSPAAADGTGLRAGTPVVAGGADTQLALIGIGVTEPGSRTVVGGTFWQHTAVLDRPLVDPQRRLRTLCHAQPDRWMIEGIGFLCGLTMRWFRDAFCAAETAAAVAAGRDPYAALEELAANVPPGADGVVGVFSNTMEAQRWIHASPSLIGFDITDPARSGKGQCVRAVEESAAYVARGHLEVVGELIGSTVDDVVFTGGAANGGVWTQIMADVLGVGIRVPVVRESTSLGAALLAATAVGLHPDLASASREVTRFERTVEPDPQRAARYDELYAAWRQIYDASLTLSEAGLTRPLWRAAGA